MQSTEKIMYLHALERMFCKCPLVDFKLMWNVNELNYAKRGLQIYPRGTWSMSKSEISWLPARCLWVGTESQRLLFITHL